MRPNEPFRTETMFDKRGKIHVFYFVDTYLVEILENFPKFLNRGHVLGFLVRKIAKTRTLNISIQNDRRRILEQWLENGIEPELEEPERATWIEVFDDVAGLFDNVAGFLIRSSQK